MLCVFYYCLILVFVKRATASLSIIHTRYEKEKEEGNHDDLVDERNLKNDTSERLSPFMTCKCLENK